MQSGKASLNPEERSQLKQLAWDSIRNGLEFGKPLTVDLRGYDKRLQQVGATFVSLHQQGNLRGCMGTLEADRSVVEDVSKNAYAAAFLDSRFIALQPDELPELDLHITLLTPQLAMRVSSEQDLLRQLQPGIDGLILECGNNRATFLPVMWKQLPKPEDFLSHLKIKAGLKPHQSYPESRYYRYSAEEF